MFKNKFKKITTIFLCVLLIFATNITVFAEKSSDIASYKKIENVYAKLNANGNVNGAYIVNHFQIKKAGTIKDFGEYANIINLTSTDKIEQNSNQVQFYGSKGDFFYQGNSNNVELPWNFNIKYYLNGKNISAEDLGGQNGILKITFQSSKNIYAEKTFTDNYVMQVSLNLDNAVCTDIKAPDALISDAGDNSQLSFTILPNSNANFTIEAKVINFTMSGFSIAAVPYNVNIDTNNFNTDDFTSQISELTDAVKKLNSGAKDLTEGITELNNGSTSILDASIQIKNGLSSLDKKSKNITDASSKIFSALSVISTQLKNADFKELSNLKELSSGLLKFKKALDSIETGLEKLSINFSDGYKAINNAIKSSSINTPTQEELTALQNTCKDNQDALNGYQKLLDIYKQYQTIISTWNNVNPAFQAVNSTLDSNNKQSIIKSISAISSQLNTMATSMLNSFGKNDISQMLTQLTNGIFTLSNNYGSFHKGLCKYVDGISTLSNNYNKYNKGLSNYSFGTNSLLTGAKKYSNGMNEFANNISEMPNQIQDTIDEMIAKYNSSNFDTVSFTNRKNVNISSVQFIISTNEIEIQKSNSKKNKIKKLGFLERLIALFDKK